MAAEIETIQVKLFTLHRNPENSLSLPANFTKHWGLLVQYYDNGELDGEQVLEGVPDESQILQVRNSPWTKRKQKQWESAPGFEKVALQAEKDYHQIPANDFVERFCAAKNKEAKKYDLMTNNCQSLVKEFLAEAAIETSLAPQTADEAEENFLKRLVLTSAQRSSELVCAFMCKQHIFPLIAGKIKDVLKTEAIGTGNKLLDRVFKQLLQNCGEEIIENLTRGLTGATSPWQLLQIPVEIFTYAICKLMGKDETFAYGMGKLSSFGTAAAVGFYAGGPWGAAISLVFWVGGEIVAWLLRKLLDWLFHNKWSAMFGDSQTEALVKRIGVNVKNLCIGVKNFVKSCFLTGEEWLKDIKKDIEMTIKQAGFSLKFAAITL